jgi:hypothetical protein
MNKNTPAPIERAITTPAMADALKPFLLADTDTDTAWVVGCTEEGALDGVANGGSDIDSGDVVGAEVRFGFSSIIGRAVGLILGLFVIGVGSDGGNSGAALGPGLTVGPEDTVGVTEGLKLGLALESSTTEGERESEGLTMSGLLEMEGDWVDGATLDLIDAELSLEGTAEIIGEGADPVVDDDGLKVGSALGLAVGTSVSPRLDGGALSLGDSVGDSDGTDISLVGDDVGCNELGVASCTGLTNGDSDGKFVGSSVSPRGTDDRKIARRSKKSTFILTRTANEWHRLNLRQSMRRD